MSVFERNFFNEYEALRVMGLGSKGSLLLVRSLVDHDLRVVKVYSEEDSAAALHEAEILNGLYHPGIPAFYGLVPIRLREPYGCGFGLVMSYIPGIPLSAAADGGLSPATVISYSMQLCDILAYLHGLPEPVLHLDLQPQNILVNEHGRLFLVDFGSSYHLSVASTAPERFGTADFAAPEIYRPGRLDVGADLYSVGMLMYYMLTGTTADMTSPIALGTCFEEICRTVRERKTGEMLAEIICRLLYPTPLLRYSDAKMVNCMLEQVRSCLQQENADPGRTRAGLRVEYGASDRRQSGFGLENRVAESSPEGSGPENRTAKSSRDGVGSKNKTSESSRDGVGPENRGLKPSQGDRILRVGICGVKAGSGVTHVALLLNEVFRRRRSRFAGNRGDYTLQVTDYGVLSADVAHRMCERTDCVLLLAGMQEWQRSAFRTAAALLPDSTVYLFNFGDGNTFRSIRSRLSEPEAKRCLRVPYIPDPYCAHPDAESFASDVCAMVLRESCEKNPYGESLVTDRTW